MNGNERPAAPEPNGGVPGRHDKRYRAFISYSHSDNREQGRKWADWLHQSLETYQIPAELVGKPNARGEAIPAQIYPVFQDEKELSANADLSHSLKQALDQSDFLVFLASPRSARSVYVQEELRHFKRSGKSDHIIAMILRGEPAYGGVQDDDQCFPDVLRHGVDAEGNIDQERTEEALAADVRLPHSREEGFTSLEAYRQHLAEQKLPAAEIRQRVQAYGERLNLAKLKIVSTILGVPLADLTQRDQAYQLARMRRKNRIVATVAAGMGGLAIAAAVAGVLAWQQKSRAQQNFALTLYTSGLNKLAQNEYGDPAAYIAAAVRGGNANATAFAESMLATKEDLVPMPNMLTGNLSFSPDGRYVAGRAQVGANMHRLQVWDVRTRSRVVDLAEPVMRRAVGKPRFDANNRVYFTDDQMRVLRLDIASGQVQELLPNPDGVATTLMDVSADGAWLGLRRPDEGLVLLSTTDAARRLTLPAALDQVWELDFAPDASAATLCAEREDNQSECVIARLGGSADVASTRTRVMIEGRPRRVSFAPGARAIAFWRSGQIDVWDGGSDLRNVSTGNRAYQWVGFNPDGQTLLALTGWESDVYRLPNGQRIASRPLPLGPLQTLLPDRASRADLSPDAAHTLVARSQRAFVQQLGPTPQLVSQIAFSPDTRLIVPDARGEFLYAYRKGGSTVSRTRVDTQETQAEFIRADAPISELHVLRTGIVGVVTTARRVHFYDAQTGQAVGKPLPMPTTLMFSADHTRVTTRTGDDRMAVWQVADGKQLIDWQQEGGLPGYVLDPGMSHILQVLGGGGKHGWQVLDLATRKPLLKGEQELSLVRFSPDGRLLAIVDVQGKVAVWRVADGHKLFEFQSIASPLLRFSPDGKVLAASEDARRLRLWNTEVGQPVGQVVPVISVTSWAEFSADGQRLFVQDATDGRAMIPSVKVIDSRNGNLISMPFATGLFQDTALVNGEQRLMTVQTGVGATHASFWQVPGTLNLLPEQLASDLEGFYGRKYDLETGAIRPYAGTGEFASWFFADPYTRATAPGATATVQQEIEAQLPIKSIERMQTLAATSLYHPLARAGIAEFIARQGGYGALVAQMADTTERQLDNLGEGAANPAREALRKRTREWLAKARQAAVAPAPVAAAAPTVAGAK